MASRASAKRFTRALTPLIVVALLVSGPLGYLLASPHQRIAIAVLSELTVALITLSVVAFMQLRRLLGFLAATAAISLSWGLLSLAFATISKTCPGFASASCSPSQLAANTLLGLVLPLLPIVAYLPARATYRSLRLLVRATKKATSSASKETAQQKSTTPQKKSSRKASASNKGTTSRLKSRIKR